MKRMTLVLTALVFGIKAIAQVGINTITPDASANLTVAPLGNDNTPKGTLLSAMTTAQRNAIVSPATGLIVYDKDVKCLMTNNGTPVAPVWQCIGGAATNSLVYSKHFHYALPSNVIKNSSDFNARSGVTNTTTQTLLSNWLATNDVSQVAEMPTLDGMRMDIVFASSDVYRPLLVNTTTTTRSLIGVTTAYISGLYQWPVTTSFPASGYLNLDSDEQLGWRGSGLLEKSESDFRILGNDGSLYRATFFGYNTASDGSGKYNIHLILEKFAPQSGGVHN